MKKAELIEAPGLSDMLRTDQVILIDVRLKEDFEAEHLIGAFSNCVFEVDFVDRIFSIAPSLDDAICVYGHSNDSHESKVAADKLVVQGYRRVFEFRDGIETWRAAELPVEGTGTIADAPRLPDGSHQIDLEQSKLEWVGRNLLNKHWGEVGLRGGSITFRGDRFVSGLVSIDMTDIRCADLANDSLHDVLIAHLQSDDFFDVAHWPKAVFEITDATPIPSAKLGAPNYRVAGNLTLRGVTSPLSFEMVAGITSNGKGAAQASFSIDRTLWNVIYGSGKFFRRLSGHLVNDMIDLQFRVVTS